MSIFAYTGLPGSGKSYTVVEQQVLPALREGRTVVTNLPLKWDLVRSELRIPDSSLREFPTAAIQATPDLILEAVPPGAVLILDEVWRLFPAGLKANQVPDAFKTAFAEHRHRVNEKGESTQIVLVTQDLAQISAFARQLVEQTFRTTKMTSIGMAKRFRTDVYAGPVSGPNPNSASALRQISGRYEEKVYRYYDSHTQSLSKKEGADERAVDRRGNVLMRPLMIAAPFVIVGLLWFGISHLLARKDHFAAVGNGAPLGLGTLAHAPGGLSSAPASAGPVYRDQWRVEGVITVAGGAGWGILTDGVHTVTVPGNLCSKDLLGWSCPYLGAVYSMEGEAPRAGSGQPIGPYVSPPFVQKKSAPAPRSNPAPVVPKGSGRVAGGPGGEQVELRLARVVPVAAHGAPLVPGGN